MNSKEYRQSTVRAPTARGNSRRNLSLAPGLTARPQTSRCRLHSQGTIRILAPRPPTFEGVRCAEVPATFGLAPATNPSHQDNKATKLCCHLAQHPSHDRQLSRAGTGARQTPACVEATITIGLPLRAILKLHAERERDRAVCTTAGNETRMPATEPHRRPRNAPSPRSNPQLKRGRLAQHTC